MVFLTYNLIEIYKQNEIDKNYSFLSSPYTNLEYNENIWIGDYSNIHSYILENVPYYIRCYENKNKIKDENIGTSLFYWRDLRYKYIPKIISVNSDIWNAWEDIITTEFNYIITKIYNEVYSGFITKTLFIGTFKIRELLDNRNKIYEDSEYTTNNLSVLSNRIDSYYSLFNLINLNNLIESKLISNLYSGSIKKADYNLLKLYTKLDYIENLVFLRQIEFTRYIATYLSNILDINLELYYSNVLQDLVFDTNPPNPNNLIVSGLINFFPCLGVRISATSTINKLYNITNIEENEYYKAVNSFENILTLENKQLIYKNIWKDLYLTNTLNKHNEYEEEIDYKQLLRSYLFDTNYSNDEYYYDIINGNSSKKERIHELDIENLLVYKTQHYDYYNKVNLLKYDDYRKDEKGEYIKGKYQYYDEEPTKNLIKYISSVVRLNTILNLDRIIYNNYYDYSLMNIKYYNSIKNIISQYSPNFGLSLKVAITDTNKNNSIYQIKYLLYCNGKHYIKFNECSDKVNTKILIYLTRYYLDDEELVGQDNKLMSIIDPNSGNGINIGTYSLNEEDLEKTYNDLKIQYNFTNFFFMTEYKLINYRNMKYYKSKLESKDEFIYSIYDNNNHFIDILPFEKNELGEIQIEDYSIINKFEYQESKLLFRLFPKYNLQNSQLSPLYKKNVSNMKLINKSVLDISNSSLNYNTQITNCSNNDLLRNDLGLLNIKENKESNYITSSYLELYRPLIDNTLAQEDITKYYREVCKIYGYNQNIDNGIRNVETKEIIEKHYDEQYDYDEEGNSILRSTNDESISIIPTDYFYNNIKDYFSAKENTLTGFKILPCRELYQINNNNAFKLVSGYQLDNSYTYKNNLDLDLDDTELKEEYNNNWIWNSIGCGFCFSIKFSLLKNNKSNRICLLSQPLRDNKSKILRDLTKIFNITLESNNGYWQLIINLPLGYNNIEDIERDFNNSILSKRIIFNLCPNSNKIFNLTINYSIEEEDENKSKCNISYSLISSFGYSKNSKEFNVIYNIENEELGIEGEDKLINAIKPKKVGDIIRFNKENTLKTCDIILFSVGYGFNSSKSQKQRTKEKYNVYTEYNENIDDVNYAKYMEYGYLPLFGNIYEFELYCSPKTNLYHYDYMLNNYNEILRLSYSYNLTNIKSIYDKKIRKSYKYQISKLITLNSNIDLIKEPFSELIDENYDIWTFSNNTDIDFNSARFRTLHYLAENVIFDSFNEISSNIICSYDTIIKSNNTNLFKIDKDNTYSFINCELKDIIYDNTKLTKYSYLGNNSSSKLKEMNDELKITLPYCVSDTLSITTLDMDLNTSLTYNFNNYNFINYIAKSNNLKLICYSDDITNRLSYDDIYVIKEDNSLLGFNNCGILSPFYICEFADFEDDLGNTDSYESDKYKDKKICEISSMNLSNIIIDNSLNDFLNPINYYTEINIPFAIKDNSSKIRQYNKTYGIRTIQDGTYKFKLYMPFKILDSNFTSNIYYLLTELYITAKTQYNNSLDIVDEIDLIPNEYRYDKTNSTNFAYKSYNNITYKKNIEELRKGKTIIELKDSKGRILKYKKVKDKYVIEDNILFTISSNPYELNSIKFSLYNALSKKYEKNDISVIKLNTNKEYNILLDFNSLCYDLEKLDENNGEYKSLREYQNNIKDFYILRGLINNSYFNTKLENIVGTNNHFSVKKYDENNNSYYLSPGYAYSVENNNWLKTLESDENTNYLFLGNPNELENNNYFFRNHNSIFSQSSLNLNAENLKKLFAYNIIEYAIIRKSGEEYTINNNTFNYFSDNNVLTTIGIEELDDEDNNSNYLLYTINNFDEESIILKRAKELTDSVNSNLNKIISNKCNILYGISNFSFIFDKCVDEGDKFDNILYNKHSLEFNQTTPIFLYNSNFNNQSITYKNWEYTKLELNSTSELNNLSFNLLSKISQGNMIVEPYIIYYNNFATNIILSQINSTSIIINKKSVITARIKSIYHSIKNIIINVNDKEINLYESNNNELEIIEINKTLKYLLNENEESITSNSIKITINFNVDDINKENCIVILDNFKILNYSINKEILIGDTLQNISVKNSEDIESSINISSNYNRYNKLNCINYGNGIISLFNKHLIYNSDGDTTYQNFEMYRDTNYSFTNPFNAKLKIEITNCEISKDKKELENKNLKILEKYKYNNENIYFGYTIKLNAYHKVFTHNKLIYNNIDNIELIKNAESINIMKEIEEVDIKGITNLSSILNTNIKRDIKNMFVNIDIEDFYIDSLSLSGHSWNNKKIEDNYKFNTILLCEYKGDEENIKLVPYFILKFPSIEYYSRDSLLFEMICNENKI